MSLTEQQKNMIELFETIPHDLSYFDCEKWVHTASEQEIVDEIKTRYRLVSKDGILIELTDEIVGELYYFIKHKPLTNMKESNIYIEIHPPNNTCLAIENYDEKANTYTNCYPIVFSTPFRPFLYDKKYMFN